MKRLTIFLFATLLGFNVWAAGTEPKLVPLTVETYLKLTIERLELSRSCWYWQKASPTPLQLQDLWNKYKTTEKDFLRFSGANAKAIEEYMEVHPETKGRIKELSAECAEYIKQKSGDNNVPN